MGAGPARRGSTRSSYGAGCTCASSTSVVALDGRTGDLVWEAEAPSCSYSGLATDGRDLLVRSITTGTTGPGGMTGYDFGTGAGHPTVRAARGDRRARDVPGASSWATRGRSRRSPSCGDPGGTVPPWRARSGMQEVELLDGDEDVAERPSVPAAEPADACGGSRPAPPRWRSRWSARSSSWTPGRMRRSRGSPAVPGVFPPARRRARGAAHDRRRRRPAASGQGSTSAMGGRPPSWWRRTGRSPFTAIDQGSGEHLWSTPLLGPDADRAESLQELLQRRVPRVMRDRGEPATVAVCLATDGFVRYEERRGRRSGSPRPAAGWWSSTPATGT